MSDISIQSLKEDVKKLDISSGNGYMYSYPHFLDHFADKNSLIVNDLVVGAYLSYGWMPKILQFNTEIVNQAVKKLNELKSAKFPFNGQVQDLKPLHKIQNTTNGSVVGMSKLLHFLNPQCFPIFDSRVYEYLYEKKPYSYRFNTLEKYLEYVSIVNRIIGSNNFKSLILKPVNDYINENFGYIVSGPRAVELVMYSTQVNRN